MGKLTYPFYDLGGQGIYRPFIPIILSNPKDPNRKYPLFALIDTGADSCMFPADVPKNLGYKIIDDAKGSCTNHGIDGNGLQTWKHEFVINLVSPYSNNIVHSHSPCLIDCCEHNNVPPLLGTDNFLNAFTLIISYKQRKIELQY